jgi:hypothetical protein
MVIIVVLGGARGGGMAEMKKQERASCKRNKIPHK